MCFTTFILYASVYVTCSSMVKVPDVSGCCDPEQDKKQEVQLKSGWSLLGQPPSYAQIFTGEIDSIVLDDFLS